MARLKAWNCFIGVVFVGHLVCLSEAATRMRNAGRICVGSDVDCSQLRKVTNDLLTCVATRDRVDCLKKLQKGEADYGYFEAEDLKMAAMSSIMKDSDVQLEAKIELSTGKEIQAVYLLVHNSSNTKPTTLCHPGVNRARVYPRALYMPTTLQTLDPSGDIQKLIVSLGRVWESACIPGMWSPDIITDNELKREYPFLCESCVRKSCSADDPYAGAGALQCLLDRSADAAFVSDVDLRAARAKNPEVENLFHFCKSRDNPIHPLGSKTKNDGEPCDWGRRPFPVILSRVCDEFDCKSQQQLLLKALSSNVGTLKSILDLPRSTQLKLKQNALSPLEILKQAGYKLDHPNFKDSVIICVQTKAEQEKCEDLAKATMAYTASEGIGVKCSLDEAGSGCYPNIYFGRADVITLDGGDVYQVTEDYGFERLLSEVYVDSSVTSASSYYAVAVIRAESNITSFEQLQGRKSCHTGIDKTAGWKMPVASLLEQRLIDPRHCNYISAIAEFFSGGSCAPGAKSNRYNKEGNYIERLCRLCTGEGENQCVRGNDEPFYSYAGAFRCLVHGGGDVAFVKHTTVPSLTGGKTSASWAVGLQADQFRLLCPLGGIAAVSEYKTCHIALVPAHEVVVSGRMPEARKTKIRETLLGISQIFNPEAAGYKTFRLFGSYHGIPDLLYKDSAVALRSLSEDTIEERARKKNYFKKLNELHGCEVRVCALEEQMHDCQAMAQTMLSVGQQFVCVSARDRYDCVRRVIRGQVDMSPVPGGFLGLDPDLRILAFMRDPVYSQQEYRYKAVMVVRRATVKNISDLRGKKSCHTGYGKTTGWRIPIAMLKRAGVIQPICEAHQSAIEHEIGSVAVTFNRACIPGAWAVSTTLDASLKNKYKAMCSMCRSKTCDNNDDYAGYEGALRCLTTENGGDVAFSKLSVVKEFFTDSRTVDSSEYGLLCPDNKIVNINSQEAENCYWAARPWDAYVTHGGASDAKVQKLFWALTEAKLKGEEDFRNRNWYFTTLGIGDNSDILPVMENVRTQDYYSKTRMDVVEAEDICTEEPVRFCVLSDEEENKCNDLKNVLRLNGITPSLQCVRGSDIDDCLSRININQADIISLNDIQRYKVRQSYNIMTLLSESYGQAGDTRYYLVGLVKKASGVISVADLAGRTTCYASHNVSDPLTIDDSLMKCLDGTSDFFHSYAEAITCLAGSNTDVAFVKVSISGEFTSNDEIVPAYLNPQNYEILCASGVLPLSASNIEDCNLGRVPANMVVTRQSDTSSRREDMINLLLKAAKYYGKSDSFFRLFYDYFSKPNLLFKDATTKLAPVTDDHYQSFLGTMWQQACGLYDHHLKMDNSY